MQQLNLKKASVFILHGDLALRTEIRLLLSEMNAKAVEFGKLSDLHNTLEMQLPAALIACADAPTDGIIKDVHDMRLGTLGQNPFLPCIAITQDDSADQKRRLIDAGFHSILYAPFNRQNIMDVVQHLCEDTRDFVVTKDFVGPQRMLDDQPEKLLPHVKPVTAPNTLEGAVKGKPIKPDAIKEAFECVTEERVKNAAYMTLAKFEQTMQKAANDPRAAFAEMVDLCSEALDGIHMTSIANAQPTFELCRSYAQCVADKGFDKGDKFLSLELIDALSRTVLDQHLDPAVLSDLEHRTQEHIAQK